VAGPPAPIGRIALASALVAALIAVALAVTVVNYRNAVGARQRAADAIGDAAAARSAEKYLARERETVSDAVLGLHPFRSDLLARRVQLRSALSTVGIAQPNERRVVRAALRANEGVNAIFADAVRLQNPGLAAFRIFDLRLDRWQEGVLAPLRLLISANNREQSAVEASATRSSRRAFLFAIFAGAIAIGGGLAFGMYADRLVREIAARNKQLRRLDRMKDDFVAAVSHELRTPLTSIRGYLDLMLDGEAGILTDEQHHFLTIVGRNADRLLRVAGDLLFVAQVEAGTLSLLRGQADLDELVRQAVDAARPAAAEKRVELEIEPDGLCEVEVDRARLAQVLDNLLSNAVKFTPAGGHVTVRTRRRGDSVALEVVDDGMGMSESELEHLFERFYRTNGAIEQAIQGTGLGLAIAKAIVEAHDGRITVMSTPGDGTTFRVELPLMQALVAA
jgi:signal transduction histidine kinase